MTLISPHKRRKGELLSKKNSGIVYFLCSSVLIIFIQNLKVHFCAFRASEIDYNSRCIHFPTRTFFYQVVFRFPSSQKDACFHYYLCQFFAGGRDQKVTFFLARGRKRGVLMFEILCLSVCLSLSLSILRFLFKNEGFVIENAIITAPKIITLVQVNIITSCLHIYTQLEIAVRQIFTAVVS